MSTAKHIISFSGGQTSGLMLRRLMDANPVDFDEKFEVVFANTGREYNETLDFVREVEMRWGVQITWLEYCRENGEHSFRIVDYTVASRRGDHGPFDEMLEWVGALPNVMGRSCSAQLKIRTQRRYLEANGLNNWTFYIGIRADEAHRAIEILAVSPKAIKCSFPLIDDGTTLAQVNAWWDKQPFKLNIPNYKGNCDLCFLKARWKRLAIIRKDPSAATWWIEQEKKMRDKGVTADGALWMTGKSYEGLLADATHPELDFGDQSEQDIPCTCLVGGFREQTK